MSHTKITLHYSTTLAYPLLNQRRYNTIAYFNIVFDLQNCMCYSNTKRASNFIGSLQFNTGALIFHLYQDNNVCQRSSKICKLGRFTYPVPTCYVNYKIFISPINQYYHYYNFNLCKIIYVRSRYVFENISVYTLYIFTDDFCNCISL